MAGYSSASLAIGVLFSDCITKDTPPPFTPPNTTFGYTPFRGGRRFKPDQLGAVVLTAAAERVEDEVALLAVGPDQLLGEAQREDCRMVKAELVRIAADRSDEHVGDSGD